MFCHSRVGGVADRAVLATPTTAGVASCNLALWRLDFIGISAETEHGGSA